MFFDNSLYINAKGKLSKYIATKGDDPDACLNMGNPNKWHKENRFQAECFEFFIEKKFEEGSLSPEYCNSLPQSNVYIIDVRSDCFMKLLGIEKINNGISKEFCDQLLTKGLSPNNAVYSACILSYQDMGHNVGYLLPCSKGTDCVAEEMPSKRDDVILICNKNKCALHDRRCPDDWFYRKKYCRCDMEKCEDCDEDHQYLHIYDDMDILRLSQFRPEDIKWMRENCEISYPRRQLIGREYLDEN